MLQDDEVYDVLVAGGGVVGLSILRAATLKGWKCALVEAEADLLSFASGSNSGIVCTGVDAGPDTLERALIRDSVSHVRLFCKELNIPIRPCGSLVCQWPWDSAANDSIGDGHSRLQEVLQESHDAGDTHATILSPGQVRHIEPNLSPSCNGAVHIPGEIVVDPWLFSIAHAVHARENGAKIFTDFFFDADASAFDGKIWTAVRKQGRSGVDLPSVPALIRAKAIVNATGLWSDILQSRILHKNKSSKSPSQWTARPRRGQYRVFQMTPKTRISHPIQPVPTQFTKGVFVFSTLYDQLCVGPTALDQESRLDRNVDLGVANDLSLHAQRIVPDLDTESSYVGDYVGVRPGTDKRDYQIHLTSDINWIAAAGIRSTGLTASLGISRHVVHLLQSLLPEPEKPEIRTTPLPDVSPDLVDQYHQRGDGSVVIQNNIYKITHPITRFGWEAKSGIAGPVKASPPRAKL
jgi:glycerol-3-phosphate dehydrogenase